MADFIEPVPIESPIERDLRDKIEFAELMVGTDPRGRKLINKMRARLDAVLNGRANDAADPQQDQIAKGAEFYRRQGSGQSATDRLNSEYAKRLGKQIQR